MLMTSIKNLAKRVLFLPKIPVNEFKNIYKINLILTVRPYTVLPYARMSNLYEIVTHLERENIKGSFVECGVMNGGSAGLIASVARHNKDRHVWLFDSWEGLPEPTEFDVSHNGRLGQKGVALGSEERVNAILR
jgi:hypothetical protein